jgi:transcriptional regulator of arginine metabolism
MSSRTHRINLLRRLISERDLSSQQDILAALKAEGTVVEQGTLSKDLKDMGVIKVRSGDGFKHVLPANFSTETQEELVHREIREFVREVEEAASVVVIRTTSGHASGVCETIDHCAWPEMVGSLAGENTIFLACRNPKDARALAQRILSMMRRENNQA